MWYNAEHHKLTGSEIDHIVKILWVESMSSDMQDCPDCSAKSGQEHQKGCDVDYCLICIDQCLACGHEGSVWDGFYPGTKECMELRLICTSSNEKPTNTKDWMFDYNELIRLKNQK